MSADPRRRRLRGSLGATLPEYALGVALIAVILIAAIGSLESRASDRLDSKGASIGAPAGDSQGALQGGLGGTTTTTTATTIPNAPPTASIDSVSCSGRTCNFDGEGADPDGGGVTYSWNFSDPPASTQENPSHAFPRNQGGTTSRTYTVTLTVTDGAGATATDATTVTCNGSGNGTTCASP